MAFVISVIVKPMENIKSVFIFQINETNNNFILFGDEFYGLGTNEQLSAVELIRFVFMVGLQRDAIKEIL